MAGAKDFGAGGMEGGGVYLGIPKIHRFLKREHKMAEKGSGDVNKLRLFRRPRLKNDEQTRRLQFIKTRYDRPKCGCGKKAHYTVTMPKRGYWCRDCLPVELRRKLDLDYQYLTYVMPLAEYLDGRRW